MNDQLFSCFNKIEGNYIPFDEFLIGIAKFTKSDFQEICEIVFKVYDLGSTGYISKEEFTKMLYNFPKEEISKFYAKIFGHPEGDTPMVPANQFQSELFESIANFNFKVKENVLDLSVNKKRSNGIIVEDSQEDSSPLIEVKTRKNSRTEAKDISDYYRGQNRRRKNSLVEDVRLHKYAPTNVGNLIAVWCDSIYEKYGDGDKLYFNQFKEWANLHKNFIFTFARYFRYNMWQSDRNEITNRETLGFYKLSPVLQETIKIKFDDEQNYRQALGCLYIEFLFIWYDRSKCVPNTIKVLKDVNILFTDSQQMIQIEQQSLEYINFRIIIDNKPAYLFWKEILTNYSR